MRLFFTIIYLFCILSYYSIGQIIVPGLPINLNILSILLLFMVCLIIEKPKIDKWMIMYFVFLIFYGISALVTGYFDEFFHRLYSFFFMSFVIYWATGILIRRFDTLSPLIYTVVFVGLIDVIVTVSQAKGIPIQNSFLASMIQDVEQDELLASRGYELGVSVSGIYASPVFNGHILLFFFLVSLLPQYEKLNVKMLLFTLVLFVGLFFCQERSAFLFSSMAFFFVFYKRIKNSKYRFLLLFVFVIASIAVFNYLSDYIVLSGSRLSQTSNTARKRIWENSINFIFDHPFFGGYDLSARVAGIYSHNVILSSFLAGGLLGGFILLVMICGQIMYILRTIKTSQNMLYYTVGVMYISILADSMLHNTGLVDMDFSTFILWGIYSTIMRNKLSPNLSLFKRNNL